MLYMGYRGSVAWAIIGGLILWLGLAVGLIIYAMMLVGSWTPLAALVVGLGIGVLVIFIRHRPDVVPAAG